jgi:hypothetical protein
MLTGRPPFAGETDSDTVAAILEREPDWSVLPAQTPPSIRRLIQRCLEKDAKRRLRDIGDARLEIEDALDPARSTGEKTAGRPIRTAWWVAAASTGVLAVAIAATVSVAAAAIGVFLEESPLGATVTRLTDFEGAEQHAAISRDGKFVAFLSDRAGDWDAWVSQIGTDKVYNLTNGNGRELRNRQPERWAFRQMARSSRSESRVEFRRLRVGGSDDGRTASALPERSLRTRLVARRHTHRLPPACRGRSPFRDWPQRESRSSNLRRPIRLS